MLESLLLEVGLEVAGGRGGVVALELALDGVDEAVSFEVWPALDVS